MRVCGVRLRVAGSGADAREPFNKLEPRRARRVCAWVRTQHGERKYYSRDGDVAAAPSS